MIFQRHGDDDIMFTAMTMINNYNTLVVCNITIGLNVFTIYCNVAAVYRIDIRIIRLQVRCTCLACIMYTFLYDFCLPTV